MNQNYDRIMEREIADWKASMKDEGRQPRLLLHSCCGPCSTSVTERLAEDIDFTVFFYNPNITDEEEYGKRLEAQKHYLKARFGENCFVEGPYDPEHFIAFADGLSGEPEGGSRCARCFELRLRETARQAKAEGYDCFTTTLTVSPMKNSQVINELGERIGREEGIPFLHSDFKKRAGYQRSIELSKEYGLYRQHFCGCEYSRGHDE